MILHFKGGTRLNVSNHEFTALQFIRSNYLLNHYEDLKPSFSSVPINNACELYLGSIGAQDLIASKHL